MNIKTLEINDAISFRKSLDMMYMSYVRSVSGTCKCVMTCTDR